MQFFNSPELETLPEVGKRAVLCTQTPASRKTQRSLHSPLPKHEKKILRGLYPRAKIRACRSRPANSNPSRQNRSSKAHSNETAPRCSRFEERYCAARAVSLCVWYRFRYPWRFRCPLGIGTVCAQGLTRSAACQPQTLLVPFARKGSLLCCNHMRQLLALQDHAHVKACCCAAGAPASAAGVPASPALVGLHRA